jgi:hypothetical protein
MHRPIDYTRCDRNIEVAVAVVARSPPAVSVSRPTNLGIGKLNPTIPGSAQLSTGVARIDGIAPLGGQHTSQVPLAACLRPMRRPCPAAA